MKQVIYIDVLICVNLFINYFILLTMAKFLHLGSKRSRLIIASLLGAAYSIIILIPDINYILSLVIKLFMAVSIVGVAFSFNFKKIIRNTLIFYIINFIFGGFIFCLWYFLSPKGIFIKNGMIYFNISPIFLACTTILAYIIIRIAEKITAQKNFMESNCEVIINFNNKEINLKAKIDTGNTLKEPFSGIPVIVADYDCIKKVLPLDMKEYYQGKSLNSCNTAVALKYRMIPFGTVAGKGVLPAFKANRVTILNKKEKLIKEAYIAVCSKKILNEDFNALINPDLLL